MKTFLGRWMPPILWMGIIFLFSTESFSSQATGRLLLPLLGWLFPWVSLEGLAFAHAAFRKIGHPLEYMILSYLWARALDPSSSFFPLPSFSALFLTGSYAAADEFHQAFVPTRTASVSDVFLDVLGAAFLQGFLWVWSKRREGKTGRGEAG